MASFRRLVICGSFLVAAAFLLANCAAAQIDPWEFEVYPYATEGRGVVEFETDNAVVLNGHSQGGTIGRRAGTAVHVCEVTSVRMTSPGSMAPTPWGNSSPTASAICAPVSPFPKCLSLLALN